jgi:3-hydroxybutyryl-CoA dehydrogenase
MSSNITKIGVIGIGTMGSGIAQTAAQKGFTTTVMDVNSAVLEAGLRTIHGSLDRLVASFEKSGGERGISAADRDASSARLSTTHQLEELCTCDIIIEAATERVEIKERIFKDIAAHKFGGILASNTSSISITRLGGSFGSPERFIGMHFMNPVPLQPGVEIIRGLLTSDETAQRTYALCSELGKTAVPAEDKAGFGINRMWIPFVNEAARVIEEGVMSVGDADSGCQLCLAHKMGPLMTADFVGLDVVVFVCEVLEAEFGSAYKASPILKRLVEAGQLGAKSGRGFYVWEGGKTTGVNPAVARYRIG